MSSYFLFLGVTVRGSATFGSVGVWRLDDAVLSGTEEIVAGGDGNEDLGRRAGVGIDGAAIWRSLALFVTNSLKNWVEVSGS